MGTKLILFLAAGAALAVVLVSTEECDPKESDPKECVEVPYPNYTMHWVKRMKPEKKRGLFPVVFHLFTKENAKMSQIFFNSDKPEEFEKSHFNPENPTRFLIHGWLEKRSHKEGSPLTKIRDQYLSVGPYNIFIVDWGQGNNDDYLKSAFNTDHAGKEIAEFINKHELIANDTYIIGFDMGAHIAGIAGKSVTSQKINTIIGLDPARSLFAGGDPSECLTKDDALYVETIHTNAGFLGLEDPIGHASFYPNYGSQQPQCSAFSNIRSCSHKLAYDYFAASITRNDFLAVQCSSYSDITEKKCRRTGITLRMGGEPSNYGHSYPGVYYLKNPSGVTENDNNNRANKNATKSDNNNAIAQKHRAIYVLKMKPGRAYVIMLTKNQHN